MSVTAGWNQSGLPGGWQKEAIHLHAVNAWRRKAVWCYFTEAMGKATAE